MSGALWTLGGLLAASGVGWLLGFTRGVRMSGDKLAEAAETRAALAAQLDTLSTRVASLSAALAAAKGVPLDHGGAVSILRDASAPDPDADPGGADLSDAVES